MWDGEFEMTWAGARRSERTLAVNMLLYWACLYWMYRKRLFLRI